MAWKNVWLVFGAIVCLWGCADSGKSREKVPAPAAEITGRPYRSEFWQRDGVGDLLVLACARADPKDAELAWYRRLSVERQEAVVAHLNQYALSVKDNVVVKARISDDYDTRWTFTQLDPVELIIARVGNSAGNSSALIVAAGIVMPPAPPQASAAFHLTPMNARIIPAARDVNDGKALDVRVTWEPGKDSAGNFPELRGKRVRLTAPLEYGARPQYTDNVCRRVDSLDGIQSLKLLPGDRAELSLSHDTYSEWQVRLSVNGGKEATTVTAQTGDNIALDIVDALGAGYAGYKYLGVKDGYLRFKDETWFYNVVAATSRLVEVRPYDAPPK